MVTAMHPCSLGELVRDEDAVMPRCRIPVTLYRRHSADGMTNNGARGTMPSERKGQDRSAANPNEFIGSPNLSHPGLLSGLRNFDDSYLGTVPRRPAGFKRNITLTKEENSRFGVDLCKVDQAVYVLSVHETPGASTIYDQLPAYRVGLSRFDKIVQVNELDVADMALEDIYKVLHQSGKVCLTVLDRPLIRSYVIHGASAVGQLEKCLVDIDGCMVGVDLTRRPRGATWMVLPNEPIAEVDGHIVLGMKQSEIAAVLLYSQYNTREGAIEVSTVTSQAMAAAFLDSLEIMCDVFGNERWTEHETLRRSLRHSKRGERSRKGFLRNSLRGSRRRQIEAGLDGDTACKIGSAPQSSRASPDVKETRTVKQARPAARMVTALRRLLA